MTFEQELLGLHRARATKKLQLFLSVDNPVWKPLAALDAMAPSGLTAKHKENGNPRGEAHEPGADDAGTKVLISTCSRLLGLTGQWRRRHLAGHIPSQEKLTHRIKDLLARLKSLEPHTRHDSHAPLDSLASLLEVQTRISDFLTSLRSGDAVYVAGHALGLSVDECQKALDRILYAQRPFLRAFDGSPDSSAAADEAFRQLGGVYYAWLRRGEPESQQAEHLYLKCALRVRYVLKLDGGHALRIKLNVPVVDPTPHDLQLARLLHDELPLIEYDGFVHRRERCFWVLEERTLRADGDLISIITTKARDRRGRLSGRYLTVGQDPDASIVHDTIVIERIPEEVFADADDEMRGRIMRSSVRAVRRDDPEFALADALFAGHAP
ncbi:hypothetical protein ACVNIS_07460 [Sphaerotilaceae bacterium SBD11-9]